MWMACFWDPATRDYDAAQNWTNTWSKDMQQQAKLCKKGLQDLMAYKASSVQRSTYVSERLEELKLAMMLAWCSRVSENLMPHGPLLAHAVQCNHMLVETSRMENGHNNKFLVPTERHSTWNRYPWDRHGHDGIDGIKRLLQMNGFWPAPVMAVSHLPTIAPVRSRREENLTLLGECAPCSLAVKFTPPRGVKVFVKEDVYQEQYSWVERAGIPADVEQCFLRPASFVGSAPGTPQVTFYVQSKGHYFYAFYQHEGTGNLVAKWVRGMTPVGKRQWRVDYAADIEIGVGHVNGFRFVNGVYLEDGGRDFPIFLYMERDPKWGQHPEQLHLFACCEVPAAVQSCVQPSAFQPRKGTAGFLQDPGRRRWMWQEKENGKCTFTVGGMLFHQERERRQCHHVGMEACFHRSQGWEGMPGIWA